MTSTYHSRLLGGSERERERYCQQMIRNIEAANKKKMNLKHQFEQILDGSSQLSRSETQEMFDQAEREFGGQKDDALKAKASGLNWNKKVTTMVLLALLLGFFGFYKVLITLDQIQMKMTKNQAQQRLYHQRTLDKVGQGAFDHGVKLYEVEPPAANSTYSGPVYGTVDFSAMWNLTLEGFKGVNIVDQQQDAMLESILSKVVNLTRKFDNFTGLEPWDTYEAEVASIQSDILTDAQIQSLVNLLPAGKTLTKAYQATKNGWTPSDFHNIVDGNGPTLTVIKNEYGRTFGGYTDIPLQGDGRLQKGNGNSFQFFFQEDEAVKIGLRNPGSSYELYFRNNLLLAFPFGIVIRSNCNTNYDSKVGYRGKFYEWPTGASSRKQAGLIVAGSDTTKFQCVEIETWFVQQG